MESDNITQQDASHKDNIELAPYTLRSVRKFIFLSSFLPKLSIPCIIAIILREMSLTDCLHEKET
jgi:hypothetical protein